MASIERRASNFTRFDDSDAVDATALAVGYDSSRSGGHGGHGGTSGRSEEWEELIDDASGQPYWHNHVSGVTTWEMPPELSSPPPAIPLPSTLPPSTLPAIPALASLPPAPIIPQLPGALTMATPATASYPGTASAHMPTFASLPPPPAPPPPADTLPSGWEMHEDDSSGAFYFFNVYTNETTWERPT